MIVQWTRPPPRHLDRVEALLEAIARRPNSAQWLLGQFWRTVGWVAVLAFALAVVASHLP